MSDRISVTRLMALCNRRNWATWIRVHEDHHSGWHEWEWCKKQLGAVIAERQRMLDAGELVPRRARRPAG
jgi:hypothetical protein